MMDKSTTIKYFLYVRKSSEAEDKQVASIDAQIDELKKLAKQRGLNIVGVFREAKSAKEPGRPIFNGMLQRIRQGEANGILCWKLDRLARNPIDGGQIAWMLQQCVVAHIQAHDKDYRPTDNVLMMSVEFGMAHQFIRDLSVNVKRGLRKKLADGWFPGPVPGGYLNTPDREKGYKIVVNDEERFPIIRKVWDLMLTGNYTPPRILEILNNDWGYKTLRRKKSGGKKLSRSGIYKILTNSFYYGYYKYPLKNGEWQKGNHKPMITKDEFDRVQSLLGRKGKPAPHKRESAFTGLMFCGECIDAQITADPKNQVICSECKYKFSCVNQKICPKCKTPIEKMKKPKFLDYIYYHCTKRRNPNCSQLGLRSDRLEMQIDEYLSKISINQKYLDWALKHLKSCHRKESIERQAINSSRQHTHNLVTKKLDRLLEMRLDGEIDEKEYELKKKALLAEKVRLQELMIDNDENQNKSLTLSENTFNFSRYARHWFKNGTLQKKRDILATLGSNLQLKDQKLSIDLNKPFLMIIEGLQTIPEKSKMFEPKNNDANKGKEDAFASPNPHWLRG